MTTVWEDFFFVSAIINVNMPVDTGQKQDGARLQLQSTAVYCLQVNTGIICNSYTPNQLLTLLSHTITRSKRKHVCLSFWYMRNKHRLINIKSSTWMCISSRNLTWGTIQTYTNHCLPSPSEHRKEFLLFMSDLSVNLQQCPEPQAEQAAKLNQCFPWSTELKPGAQRPKCCPCFLANWWKRYFFPPLFEMLCISMKESLLHT